MPTAFYSPPKKESVNVYTYLGSGINFRAHQDNVIDKRRENVAKPLKKKTKKIIAKAIRIRIEF